MNENVQIVSSNDWGSEDAQFIRTSLMNYNREKAPTTQNPPSETINLFLKCNNQVIGGLLGGLYRYCYFVDYFWIDESYRNCGYGKKLLLEIEAIVKLKGCKLIHLDTFNFQAPEFYKKNGYEVYGVLDGYPEGIVRYSLKKVL